MPKVFSNPGGARDEKGFLYHQMRVFCVAETKLKSGGIRGGSPQ